MASKSARAFRQVQVDFTGIAPSNPAKRPRRPAGEVLNQDDLLARFPAAHAYWQRLKRTDAWEFILGPGPVLEAWPPDSGDFPAGNGGGLAFTWDLVESRWKQIT